MAKIKMYKAGRACQIITCSKGVNNPASVPTYQDTSGNSYSQIAVSAGTASTASQVKTRNFTVYNDCTGYASADTETDFDLDDYTTSEIADLAYIRSTSNNNYGQIYTIAVTNNGASDVTVGSFKFTKSISYDANQGTITCLVWGAFLDTPVTLGVGETKTFAISLDFYNY